MLQTFLLGLLSEAASIVDIHIEVRTTLQEEGSGGKLPGRSCCMVGHQAGLLNWHPIDIRILGYPEILIPKSPVRIGPA